MRQGWFAFTLCLALAGAAHVDALAAQDAPKCRVKGDPLLLGVASFFVPGLGQFLNGEDGKGLTHLVIGLALPTAVLLVSVMAAVTSPVLSGVLIVVAPALYLAWAVYSAMDAYRVAEKYCRP
jgi:TM2 domain-containing membrane protein YozV